MLAALNDNDFCPDQTSQEGIKFTKAKEWVSFYCPNIYTVCRMEASFAISRSCSGKSSIAVLLGTISKHVISWVTDCTRSTFAQQLSIFQLCNHTF